MVLAVWELRRPGPRAAPKAAAGRSKRARFMLRAAASRPSALDCSSFVAFLLFVVEHAAELALYRAAR